MNNFVLNYISVTIIILLSPQRMILIYMCLTLCNPMDCSPPGSSVHGVLYSSILESVTIPFSRGSSQFKDQNWVSCIAGRFFTIWDTKEAIWSIYTVVNLWCSSVGHLEVFYFNNTSLSPYVILFNWRKNAKQEMQVCSLCW